MIHHRIAAQNLLQESMDQAIRAINEKMGEFAEGDFITVSQPIIGDWYYSEWGDHGIGELCRIISMKRGEYPGRFTLDTDRKHYGITYRPHMQSQLPSWKVEGIGGNRHGQQVDLCDLSGGKSVKIGTSLIGREPYYAHLLHFRFLSYFDERQGKFDFSTSICYADNAIVKNVIEQHIKVMEKARQEQLEEKRRLEQRLRESAAISKSELDSLFHQMKNM